MRVPGRRPVPLLAALALAGGLVACATPGAAPPASDAAPPASDAAPPASDAAPPASDAAPRVLTVVGISDFHGRLEPHRRTTLAGETVEVGGAALLGGYLEILREAAPGPVLVLDAGDMWQGTLASNLQEGAPVVRLYEHLGVAAAAVGNHEFDFGPAGEAALPTEPGDDPQGALKARAAQATFPLLAANLRASGGGRPEWVRPSVVVEVEGVRVGVIGAANPATAQTTARPNLEGLEFLDPVPEILEEARRLRAAGVEVVAVAIHDGSRCRPPSGAAGLAGCGPGGFTALAEALPPGLVDVVVGGHTHAEVARVAGGTAYVQSGSQGRALTWAEVPLDGGAPRARGPVELCSRTAATPNGRSCAPDVLNRARRTDPAVFLGRTVRPDPEAARLVAPALERVRAVAAQPVGFSLEAPLTTTRASASPFGVLVAEVLRRSVPGAQVGVMNSGGVRSDLPAGPVTRGDLFQALPFDNRPAELTLSGARLARMVSYGHGGSHGALQWSGLTYTARGCEVTGIRVGGAPLDPAGTYRVVTNDYLAGGGDGFDGLGLGPEQVTVRYDLPWLRDLVARALDEDGTPLVAAARKAASEAVERAPACVVDSGG